MQQTEAGAVWRGAKVTVYVDGVKVGVTTGGEATPHLLISRLCEGETSESDGAASALLGWRQALPPLPPGRHLVLRRCFTSRSSDRYTRFATFSVGRIRCQPACSNGLVGIVLIAPPQGMQLSLPSNVATFWAAGRGGGFNKSRRVNS